MTAAAGAGENNKGMNMPNGKRDHYRKLQRQADEYLSKPRVVKPMPKSARDIIAERARFMVEAAAAKQGQISEASRQRRIADRKAKAERKRTETPEPGKETP